MREAVTIFNGSRMRADPLDPQNAVKTKIDFGAFIILFESTTRRRLHDVIILVQLNTFLNALIKNIRSP